MSCCRFRGRADDGEQESRKYLPFHLMLSAWTLLHAAPDVIAISFFSLWIDLPPIYMNKKWINKTFGAIIYLVHITYYYYWAFSWEIHSKGEPETTQGATKINFSLFWCFPLEFVCFFCFFFFSAHASTIWDTWMNTYVWLVRPLRLKVTKSNIIGSWKKAKDL